MHRLHQLVDLNAPFPSPSSPPPDTEIVIGTWWLPYFDEELLQKLPNLRGVFYGAGSIRSFASPGLWDRNIPIVSAAAANAIPVAEYTVAVIILGLKRFFFLTAEMRKLRNRPKSKASPGNLGARVGLISFGKIARLVAQHLKAFGPEILVYDPFLSEKEAQAAGVILSPLDDLFSTCDVVSLHSPNLPETQGMIRGEHFEKMMPNAVFINTARGQIVREDEMIEVLQMRSDIQAILDVTFPEPPAPESPLYEMPNIILSPHIAGAVGRERARLGHLVADEIERFLKGEPLLHAVSRETAETTA